MRIKLQYPLLPLSPPASLSMKTRVSVPNAKQKKRASTRQKGKASPLQIDAQHLQLASGSFTTADKGPLRQLSLEEITPQASGVCFCTASQAAPFLSSFQSISTEALALVTTSELDPEMCGGTTATALQYPSIFTPTGEGVLVRGTMLQLGDVPVQLAQEDMDELEAVPTVVVKVAVFRDELPGNWEEFAVGPIRSLLGQIPALSICKDAQRKQDCARYHPPVDEPAEQLILDIWARNFSRLEGGREVGARSHHCRF